MKDITKDLYDRLALLHNRYVVVFVALATRTAGISDSYFVGIAAALEEGLRTGDADSVAMVRGVVDPAELDRAEFWGTPLGRLLFVAGGYQGQTVTQTMAAGLLGCSRQWVNAMVAEGKLTPGIERGVYADQVREVLRVRAERLGIDALVN